MANVWRTVLQLRSQLFPTPFLRKKISKSNENLAFSERKPSPNRRPAPVKSTFHVASCAPLGRVREGGGLNAVVAPEPQNHRR